MGDGTDVGELGFRRQDIEFEMKASSEHVRRQFAGKLRLLHELIDLQSRLTGIYYKGITMKQALGLSYSDNVVVNNALLNLPYISRSVLLLVENTLYGSARVVERQFFESLVIAKFSEHNPEIVVKWRAKMMSDDRKHDISFGNDVMNKLIGKDLSAIKRMWREFNDMTHPTTYAQQVIRLPDPRAGNRIREIKKWRAGTNFDPDIHYSLDLLFVLLLMDFHLLISNWGRKSYRWWFGYDKDPWDVWRKEKKIKARIRAASREYFQLNKDYGDVNRLFRQAIRQYVQNWKVGRQ